MGSTYFLISVLRNLLSCVVLVLVLPVRSYCQGYYSTTNIGVQYHLIEIDKTVHRVTQFTDEAGKIWFRKGFIENDGDEGNGMNAPDAGNGAINYNSHLPPKDTITTFSNFINVNPDTLESIFFADVFYSLIGDIFFRKTSKVLFDEKTVIAAHEYKDFQSKSIEFEFTFMNLPIVEGTNTLYYCHFVSSDINGLHIARLDSSMVEKRKFRRVERGLEELRATNEILHCAQFRKPDLLFVEGVRYYFVPECLAYGNSKPDPEEKKKFSKIQGPMLQLYSIGNFDRNPNFFQWVKSWFR